MHQALFLSFVYEVPCFDVLGSKILVYCKRHAANGMVDVRSKAFPHDSCVKWPRWGVLTESSASTCAHYKSDPQGGPAINLTARCQVQGCNKVFRWGLRGTPPTRCPVNGRDNDGLVHTVGVDRTTKSYRSSSYGAVRGALFHVKAECSF